MEKKSNLNIACFLMLLFLSASSTVFATTVSDKKDVIIPAAADRASQAQEEAASAGEDTSASVSVLDQAVAKTVQTATSPVKIETAGSRKPFERAPIEDSGSDSVMVTAPATSEDSQEPPFYVNPLSQTVRMVRARINQMQPSVETANGIEAGKAPTQVIPSAETGNR